MAVMTTGAVAERLAEAEPRLPAAYFGRQIRHLLQRKLIRPTFYRGIGTSSGALLSEYDVCAAYLLSALIRLGLKAEQLRPIARYFDYIGVTRPEQDGYFGSLREVIRATKAGKRWFLIVRVKDLAGSDGSGAPEVYGEFHERPDPAADDRHWLAVIVLDCEQLLRPLLEALYRQGDPEGGVITERDTGPRDEEAGADDGSEAATPHRSRRRLPTGNKELVP